MVGAKSEASYYWDEWMLLYVLLPQVFLGLRYLMCWLYRVVILCFRPLGVEEPSVDFAAAFIIPGITDSPCALNLC